MEVAVLLIVLRQACEVVDLSVPRQTSSESSIFAGIQTGGGYRRTICLGTLGNKKEQLHNELGQ